ncbi:ArsR/SmtB family transcription factor [Spirosoma pollinicola]|uniref:Transcriptional regulator n=1 Tax=Spirosoma pollinicola TaxID=2057025 RepID=A0A2K8ZAP4_9BACT|nr:transcriptional regulator [Spirosoma pollinicola]
MAVAQKLTKTTILLGTVAHPTRLRIMLLLNEHNELSVSALTKHLGKNHSSISHDLTGMRTNGLVKSRRELRKVFYSLTEPTWIGCIKTFINSRIV